MKRASAARIQNCKELGAAIGGSMGQVVEKHETMIMDYYFEVLKQANRSFWAATVAAIIGFAVIIYSFWHSTEMLSPGVISGALIEVIAGGVFWLYDRGARQFSNFHICLERMHRYLIAYEMIDEKNPEREKILGSLVCIMANAPLISHVGEVQAPNRVTAVREFVAASAGDPTAS